MLVKYLGDVYEAARKNGDHEPTKRKESRSEIIGVLDKLPKDYDKTEFMALALLYSAKLPDGVKATFQSILDVTEDKAGVLAKVVELTADEKMAKRILDAAPLYQDNDKIKEAFKAKSEQEAKQEKPSPETIEQLNKLPLDFIAKKLLSSVQVDDSQKYAIQRLLVVAADNVEALSKGLDSNEELKKLVDDVKKDDNKFKKAVAAKTISYLAPSSSLAELKKILTKFPETHDQRDILAEAISLTAEKGGRKGNIQNILWCGDADRAGRILTDAVGLTDFKHAFRAILDATPADNKDMVQKAIDKKTKVIEVPTIPEEKSGWAQKVGARAPASKKQRDGFLTPSPDPDTLSGVRTPPAGGHSK